MWPQSSWLETEHLRSYAPCAPALFTPARIILAKGAYDDDGRRDIVERICKVFPKAEVVHQPDVPHNRIDLGTRDAFELHYRGKQTLVLGEHRTTVRFSQEEGNTCPNYWHFSPYAFCPYDCRYCYLAGTPGVRFSPTVKILLNLPEMLSQIDRAADAAGQPVAFYLGKLQDGLALDPLTGFMRVLVPFFAAHRWARLALLANAVRQLCDASLPSVVDLLKNTSSPGLRSLCMAVRRRVRCPLLKLTCDFSLFGGRHGTAPPVGTHRLAQGLSDCPAALTTTGGTRATHSVPRSPLRPHRR